MPTVTGCSNCSPVMPSNRAVLPEEGSPAEASRALISLSCAPSNTAGTEPDAALHARGYPQQHFVIEFEQLAQRSGSSKLLFDRFADQSRGTVGFNQGGNLLAQLGQRPSPSASPGSVPRSYGKGRRED